MRLEQFACRALNGKRVLQLFFFFQAEDGIRDIGVTGVQTCALPISLAAQLYGEFRELFPHNAVEYFVSYYDYYQPEAYVPSSDTYIAKDASTNEHIEQMRLSATKALLERSDAIIVATVSCIYGLGDPQ